MENRPKPPIAINKASKVRAEVRQIDWGSHSVFVTFPNPDGDIDIGDFWDFDECDIFPAVCYDKNKNPVYAGDKAKAGDCEGTVDRVGGICIESEDGHLHHVWPAEIELTESETSND